MSTGLSTVWWTDRLGEHQRITKYNKSQFWPSIRWSFLTEGFAGKKAINAETPSSGLIMALPGSCWCTPHTFFIRFFLSGHKIHDLVLGVERYTRQLSQTAIIPPTRHTRDSTHVSLTKMAATRLFHSPNWHRWGLKLGLGNSLCVDHLDSKSKSFF